MVPSLACNLFNLFYSPQGNHGTVPRLSWHTHRIKFSGLLGTGPVSFSMAELLAKFADSIVTFPCTLNCAGNRRKEQNLISRSIGFDWGRIIVKMSEI
jgi:hypothetical protein